jgi:hypothetical protein
MRSSWRKLSSKKPSGQFSTAPPLEIRMGSKRVALLVLLDEVDGDGVARLLPELHHEVAELVDEYGAVGLDEDLLADAGEAVEEVAEARLGPLVQVELGLLHDEDGALGGEEAGDEDGEDLADADADGGEDVLAGRDRGGADHPGDVGGGRFPGAHVMGDAEVTEPDVHRIFEGGGLDLLRERVPEAEELLAVDCVDGGGVLPAGAHVVGLAGRGNHLGGLDGVGVDAQGAQVPDGAAESLDDGARS